ncbi:helix-turn-helix domain-containing protein [Niastella sp. OAS944]|uniref:helix-turn-helix domain-containing protein n=1 Tax=Niastella sp. OAS944 TaxID=2664089 RepID=UPI00347C93AA|nr:excisionase family DNA binding protein [Chitinophagaceae bacterium OAS944]
MKENNANTPVLIPMEQEEFWGQIRLIIREELAKLQKGQVKTTTAIDVPGLTYKPLYKMREVCQLFGVTRQTIYDWIEHGKLKPYRMRSRVYFLHNDIIKILPI